MAKRDWRYIIRSKETQIINEEILNKFFFQQEQQKQSKEQITQLQNNKNQLLPTNSKIIKECQKFYQSLYEKQNSCKTTQEELLKEIHKIVNIDQNDHLTKKIEKKELKQAINQMEEDKSPGVDGIPVEFIKPSMTY